MKYYHLKSIIGSNKQKFPIKSPTDSFYSAPAQKRIYIEPPFEEIAWPANTEHPSVIFVSAVGATGKTTLAQQLSLETGLPILDLAKHKPVGDNSLSGILMQAFDFADISKVLKGISEGSYGIIVDGIDEGRSKTTEKAFEAFLDDIVKLCGKSAKLSFVLLGRTQIVEESWLYLDDKGVKSALVTISPFGLEEANKYIDAFSTGKASPHSELYVQARDAIVAKLSKAFTDSEADNKSFLSFMGYPPVLDAIVTLLTDEQNYHKLLESLNAPDATNIEASLLNRIATYILNRERDQKVIPNIVAPLLHGTPPEVSKPAYLTAYCVKEQCARLISHCLNKTFPHKITGQPVIDEQYETAVDKFLFEHPFLAGREFRSAVFEAVALAKLMAQPLTTEIKLLLDEYFASKKQSYHLVYMLDAILTDRHIDADYVRNILNAAMEFRSVHANVELRIEGMSYDEYLSQSDKLVEADINISILLGEDQEQTKTFSFSSTLTDERRLEFGPKLAGAYITVPCIVALVSSSELDFVSPLEISAREISLDASGLVIRPCLQKEVKNEILFDSHKLNSRLQSIAPNGIPLTFSVIDTTGLYYPVIQHVKKRQPLPANQQVLQKYFRLRRILMEFASHSKGGLAKYKNKIEHDRVLKNEIGRAVLVSLVQNKILTLSGSMYHLEPDGLNKHLGVSWIDLRLGQIPDSLVKYLQSIQIPV